MKRVLVDADDKVDARRKNECLAMVEIEKLSQERLWKEHAEMKAYNTNATSLVIFVSHCTKCTHPLEKRRPECLKFFHFTKKKKFNS